MPRGPMSAEGRAKIAEAAKRRWAKFRKEKKSGRVGARVTRKKRGRPGRKPGRRPGRPASIEKNPYLQMTITELVQAKTQIDEAWDAAQRAFSR